MKEPEPESVRLAMDQAWRDHHHARDQTWKAVQIEAVLGAGLVTVDAQFGNIIATCAAGALVIVAAFSGILISLHHRNLEIRKLIHVLNCEEHLGLRNKKLIPSFDDDKEAGVKRPTKIPFWRVFDYRERNTAVFIMRMHIAIMVFAIIVVSTRIYSSM